MFKRALFEEEGFRGNRMEYYDPRNSFLNNVIDRRMGIPITLSIVYLEVGWRLGIPLHGVNFPGHFLVRYAGEAVQLLVDPFQSGMVRFEDESQDLLDQESRALHNREKKVEQELEWANRGVKARVKRHEMTA